MWVTVIDGVIHQAILADEILTVERYRMPTRSRYPRLFPELGRQSLMEARAVPVEPDFTL